MKAGVHVPLVAAPVRVADAVWIAAALLQREHPSQPDFSLQEIVDRAQREPLGVRNRATLYAHVTQHCVANVPPSSGRYRLLYATGEGRRRLYRPGDVYNRKRERGRMLPDPESIPRRYRALLDWYRDTFASKPVGRKDRLKNDPILQMRGLGSEIWADEDADTYVRRLREDWE